MGRPGSMIGFNVDDGFLEAILRGYRSVCLFYDLHRSDSYPSTHNHNSVLISGFFLYFCVFRVY